jgi:hypothetical protein
MLQRLLQLRPLAYHTCSELNFVSIRRVRALRSAAKLLKGTPHESLLGVQRRESRIVSVPWGQVEVRDNRPLRIGSLSLEAGCTLEDFLLLLNGRVFLWPGDSSGPCKPGPSHFARYQGQGPVHLLRVPLSDLVAENSGRELEVTFCNSGSARHQGGMPVVRGPSTFVPVGRIDRPPSKVKELCFVGAAALPHSTEWATCLSGPWHPL